MAKFYRGVTEKGTAFNRQYLATVRSKGATYNCGLHATPIEAAKARDRKILEKGLKIVLQVLKLVVKAKV